MKVEDIREKLIDFIIKIGDIWFIDKNNRKERNEVFKEFCSSLNLTEEDFIRDIEIGIKNGYSIEYQYNLINKILKGEIK